MINHETRNNSRITKKKKKQKSVQKSEIHVRLRDTTFYRSWDIPSIVSRAGLKLKETSKFKLLEEFEEMGYKEARTNPATREAPSTKSATTYVITV